MSIYKQEFRDGEVMGVDVNGHLILWNATDSKPYNCGETLAEFQGKRGENHLDDHERFKVGLRDRKTVNTALLPHFAAPPDDRLTDVKEFGNKIVEGWKSGEICSIEWVVSRFADCDMTNSLAYGGNILSCRAELVKSYCEINALRIEVEALKKLVGVLTVTDDAT